MNEKELKAEIENYGIRVLKECNGNLYVGTATSFLQLYKGPEDTEALEIWRYPGSGTDPLDCLVGEDSILQPKVYDGFGSVYNKYVWSMTACGGKLWVGTANVQLGSDPLSFGCEVWCYDVETGWIPIVKNAAETSEKPNGFGQQFNLGARSMIEFPGGHLIVGTFVNPIDSSMPGCEIWM